MSGHDGGMKTLIDIDTNAIRQPLSAVTDHIPSIEVPSVSVPDLPSRSDLPDLADLGDAIADGAIVVGRRGTRLVRTAVRGGRRGVQVGARGVVRGANGSVRFARDNPKAAAGLGAALLAVIIAMIVMRKRREESSSDAHLAAVA